MGGQRKHRLGYDDVLPYFINSEDNSRLVDAYHGAFLLPDSRLRSNTRSGSPAPPAGPKFGVSEAGASHAIGEAAAAARSWVSPELRVRGGAGGAWILGPGWAVQ